ncbi:DNA alkylation repair protein [Corynebacterium riegelii]|nr:DNA alkylation repair protein [Corynebacterium riegelii]
MKDYFNAETAQKLGTQLGIDGAEYAAWVAPHIEELEILDRVTVFAQGLRERLDGDYVRVVGGVVDKLGPELAEGEGYVNHAFHLWPVSRLIELYGLDEPEVSLNAIEALTRAFTGEFAVRPFLERYPELTMSRVNQWADSDSHNVRRLASEGIRPRLPWAKVHTPFVEDPTPIIPVLDRLYNDASLFVRKSVANNLNDIGRTHPELALATASRWAASGAPHAAWVVERGLRGLIKRGHSEALELVGFAAPTAITATRPEFPHTVAIGENATLSATLTNTGDTAANVLAEYRLHFLKKNGTRQPSVFRLGKYTLEPGETRVVSKAHPFRVTSTRTYYPGTQAVSLVINGREGELVDFELTAP